MSPHLSLRCPPCPVLSCPVLACSVLSSIPASFFHHWSITLGAVEGCSALWLLPPHLECLSPLVLCGEAQLDPPPLLDSCKRIRPAESLLEWKQREGEPRALAMLISLALRLNPVGICHRCQERRRSWCIIKGFAQWNTGN